jgi:hypothetical protein
MKKLLFTLAIVALLPFGTHARYSAYAISSYEGSFGAYGFAYNYRTANGAVNAAVNIMPGYSPYNYRYSSRHGYCAFARGYDSSYTFWYSGYTRGYRTRSGAISAAKSLLPYYGRYSRSYRSGYNH